MTPPAAVQASEEAIKNTVEEAMDYMQPCVASQKKAMVTSTLSPTAEEDDYQMPKALQKVLNLSRADLMGHFSQGCQVFAFQGVKYIVFGGIPIVKFAFQWLNITLYQPL